MESSFVPMLNNVKDKNIEFLLKRMNKLNTSNPTESDFQSLNRKKSTFEMIMLSLVVFGIEICYAAETAFVNPILQKIGVPIQYMSMVWGLSPMIGFFACPILGSLSDGCNSKLGRRRPFIIIYSIGILIGLLLTGYGHVLGSLVWSENGINPFIIFFTIIGVVLLDFNCDACQSPARAYLIDVSLVDDHTIGLSTFTVMAGSGGCLGYLLGGIPWAEIGISNSKDHFPDNNNQTTYFQSDLAYDHKQILFTFVAIIYIFCALVSITSFKEIPLNQLEKKSKKKLLENSNIKYEKMEESEEEDQPPQVMIKNDQIQIDICEQEKQSQLEILKYYLSSIIKMPKSLRWLCLTHCFCWMSLLCYSLYFTDFVGEEIYGGQPIKKETNQELHILYDKGVRIGSLCMALYSISCSIYSFFLRFLIKNFRTKNVYMFSQMVYSIGMLLLAMSKSKAMAAITSITAGIMYSSLFTIPFILVANYHSTETFELMSINTNDDSRIDNKIDEKKIRRGLGTDLSLMSSMVFVAQFILSFFIGSLMKLVTKSIVIYTGSILSFFAFITSTRLLYLD